MSKSNINETDNHRVICRYMMAIKFVTYDVITNKMLRCTDKLTIFWCDVLESKKCNHICPFDCL